VTEVYLLCSKLVYLDNNVPVKWLLFLLYVPCLWAENRTLPAKLSDFAAGNKSFYKSQKVTYKQARYELHFSTQADVIIIPTSSQET